jgi:hypothetical protein
MVPNLSDTPALAQLQGAFAAGDVHLVDEHARPVTFDESLDERCWAHLRDAADGQVFVHELKGSRELLQPNYLELLGLNV